MLDTADNLIAPARLTPRRQPWRGCAEREPREYRVQVVIPHLDTPEPLELAVEMWRAQTVRPMICIVDTGSLSQHLERVLSLEADDVEVHLIRGRGWQHPSQPVAVAQDVALAVCQSEFQFCTHSDVFPMRRDVLQSWHMFCGKQTPVVGYEISPRDHCQPGWLQQNWRGLVGHTATMLHVPTIKRHGITWDYERTFAAHDTLNRSNASDFDTEVGFGLHLRAAGIEPVIVGHDVNYRRQADQWVDHVRSHASSKVFAPDQHDRATDDMHAAMAAARERLEAWRATQ